MAVISFAALDETFNLGAALATYMAGPDNIADATGFIYVSSANNDVGFLGTGITYTSGVPSGGTITQFYIDLGFDNIPEMDITGLSFNAALLAPLVNGGLTAEQQNDLVWRVMLSGNDTIALGTSAVTGNYSVTFAGDGRNVASGTFIDAGDDTITGSPGAGTNVGVSGDVLRIDAGATVFGGNDTMTLSLSGARVVVGDADAVSGFLLGGADTMNVTFTAINQTAYGDAYRILAGVVIAGNDTITVSGAIGGTVRGDSFNVDSGAVLVGGNDTIYGGGQADNIIGDASTVGGSAQGGNDTIYGGNGGDTLVGDFYQGYGNSVGGNDTIYGGAGEDSITGDASTFTPNFIGGNDSLYGGADNDFLSGGGGNDLLRGDSGMDTLNGGDGFDTASFQYGTGANINVGTGTATDGEGSTDTFSGIEQYIGSAYYRDVFTGTDGVQYFLGMGGNDYVVDNGTGGGDVFNGGDGFDTIAFYNRNAATVNLATNSAIIDGVSNMIMGFEEVYGSNTGGDTIVGDAGNNTFWGFGGGDVLVGGRGLDTLNGGSGNDTFGFNASDLQAGIYDVISDFHEVANTDRDILYFNGVAQNQLIFGAANGGVYVSTQALGGTGGVFVAGMTIAGLQDQLLFT